MRFCFYHVYLPARKAGSIVPRDLVGNWLYGVAYRTAVRARVQASKRPQQLLPEHEPVITRPTRFPPASVNQTLASGPAAMPSGKVEELGITASDLTSPAGVM